MSAVITKQPTGMFVPEGTTPESLKVEATGVVSYQWKKAKSGTGVSGATVVAGATSAEMQIPADLPAGSSYYFCTLTDSGNATVNTDIVAVVVGSLYMTGREANALIATMSPEIQDRFAKTKIFTGIPIPDDDIALRTMQIELVMSVI